MELKTVIEEDPRCRKCGSYDVRTAGKRLYAKRHELRQVYQCRKCNATFTAGRAFRQWHDAAVIEYAMQKVAQGYRPKDVVPLVKRRFDQDIKEATVRQWVGRFSSVKLSRRNMRVADPRSLMVAVRELVPLETVAKKVGASPVVVDTLMKEIAFIGEYPKFLKLGWELRYLTGAEKNLQAALRTIDKVKGNLRKRQKGGGRFGK